MSMKIIPKNLIWDLMVNGFIFDLMNKIWLM